MSLYDAPCQAVFGAYCYCKINSHELAKITPNINLKKSNTIEKFVLGILNSILSKNRIRNNKCRNKS